MKIFDTRWVGAHGIGRFAAEVYQRLDGFADIGITGRPASPFDPLALTRYLRSSAPALFFSPGYNAPLGKPCPFVFCVHDLNHLHVRENSSALKRAYYRCVMRPAIHRSIATLTVSEYSRHAICEWAGIDESRVVNVGNGVSAVFRPEGPVAPAQERPYFLYVGSHRKHKNFERILQAFAASGLWREFRLLGTLAPTQDLQRTIDRLHLARHVSFVGTQSEDALAALYRGAVALVFVSLYEGFGLPIVEAMACGTPVITSSVTSMPEVAGQAALLVDPYDVGAIASAMRKLAEDRSFRESLRARGIERAKLYSWDATAGKIKATLTLCASH